MFYKDQILYIRERNHTRELQLDSILYCEAQGAYTVLHLKDSRIMMICLHLRKFAAQFEEGIFCRIHHKYLVGMSNIRGLALNHDERYAELTGGTRLPVSRRKAVVLQRGLA